jgi:cyclophilin family peptidyl-prolyl cis-trans isomerase
MALSGPDTGGSQFFITLGPQPHLDGTYTVFGQVESGMDLVQRITAYDAIRTIRRQ